MPGNEANEPAEAPEFSEVVGAAIALVDGEGTVTGWTRAGRRLLGYPAQETVNGSVSIILASAEDQSRLFALASRNRMRSGWSGIVAVRHRDGHRFDAALRIFPLFGADGSAQWLISSTDMDTGSSVRTGLRPSSLLGRAPIGIVVRDPDMRCRWVNHAAEIRDGIPGHVRLGRRLTQARPDLQSEGMEAVARQVLTSDRAAIDLEYPVWLPENTQAEWAFSASFFRLDGADGRAVGVCAMLVDSEDKERAHKRLAVLNESSTRIGSTLDVRRTAQELADLAVPFLADMVTVDVTGSVPFGEESLARVRPVGRTVPTFRRAGLASIREGAPEAAARPGQVVFITAESPYARVMSSGKAHLEPVLAPTAGTWLEGDPVRASKAADYGIHSLMVVPIYARGTVLGLAAFIRSLEPEPFDADDLLLAEELVSRAALSIDNASRYTREHTTALALQRNLLPKHVAGGAAVDVAWRYLPAGAHDGVGGDWFDVIPLSGARVALVVGDVVGHGINSAATMGTLRTAIRTLADMDLPPGEVLARLDDLVIRFTAPPSEKEEDEAIATAALGATCLYVIYDPVNRQCSMATAGHPPPAIVDSQGRATFPDLPTGTPLGLGLVPFEALTMELPEATTLALYTDGLVETLDNDIDAGMERLRTSLALPGQPLEELCSHVIDTLAGQPSVDDITLLIARTHTLGRDQVTSWELDSDPAVVATARSLAVRQLDAWGLRHLAAATELIVSELVTNAVRHCGGPIQLRLILHQTLTVEVLDTSDSFPRLRHARTTDEGGRGLFLVARSCQRWGARYAPGGKVVWAEQELNNPADRPVVGPVDHG
jgi:PAS domain S-box-containing protein